MSARSILTFISALFFSLTLAQDTSILYPTTAAASATPLPSATGYTYAGCFNETTKVPGTDGARALQNGMESANNTMTATACLEFCSEGPNGTAYRFAGIEYGRECYCGQYVSVFSEKISDDRCNFACNGNASEVCGGQLAITLYNLTSDSKTGVAWSLGSGSTWYGSAALVTLLAAALL